MEDYEESPQIRVKQPPVLFSRTQDVLQRLSARLGGPVISYWNNPRGAVCSNDVLALYEILQRLGHHETLFLFIKSDGGSGQESLRMVNLLRQPSAHKLHARP